MLTQFPGPLILPDKHDDQPVIFNAVRTNAKLQFNISPISKRRHVKIEPVLVGKGKEKASAESRSCSPIPRFPNLPTPISNDLREYKTVPELAASLHKHHAEGDSGSAATCACCKQAAYRLMNPPPVQEWEQEDPRNMSPTHDSDSNSTGEASDESPVREGKRAKRSTDDPALLLTQPFKPRSPNTYQPNQPSSLQQVQYQSDVDFLLNLPPDPMINYPPSQPLPMPDVDLTHFGHNPSCAEGTLKGIYSIQIDEPKFRSNAFSKDFCPCESEDACVCVGCADHPENPATIRHVMEGLNFQATDAYYNNPDFVMPDIPAEDDEAPATDNLANPGHSCCVKLKAPSNTIVPTHPQTDLAAKFPTLSLDPNQSNAAASSSFIPPQQAQHLQPFPQSIQQGNAAGSSSPLPPQQARHLQPFPQSVQTQSIEQVNATAQHIAWVKQLIALKTTLPSTQGQSSGTPSSADAMPFAEYLRRRQAGEPTGVHLAVVKAVMAAVSEARAEAKREKKPFARKLQNQIEKDVAARTYAEWGCLPPGQTDQTSQVPTSTLTPTLPADVPGRQSGARAKGHSQSLRSLGQSKKKAQTQAQKNEAPTRVSGLGGGSSSNEFRSEPLPVHILNSAVANTQYMSPQGQVNQDDGAMNIQAENIQPAGQSNLASSSAKPYIQSQITFEADPAQALSGAPQLSVPPGIEQQPIQLPLDFEAQLPTPDEDAQSAALLAEFEEYIQSLPDSQAQYSANQDESGQAPSSTGVFPQPQDPQSSTSESQNVTAQGQTGVASYSMDYETQYMQHLQTQGLANFQPQAQFTPNPLTLGSTYNPNLMPEPTTMTIAQLQAFQQQLRLQQQQVQEMLDQQAFNMPYYQFFATNTINNTNNQQDFHTVVNTNNQQDLNTIVNTDDQQDFTMYGALPQGTTTGFDQSTMELDTINPDVLQQEQGGGPVSQTTTGFPQPTMQFETINPNVLQLEQGDNISDGRAVPQGTAAFLGVVNPNVLQQKQGGNDDAGQL